MLYLPGNKNFTMKKLFIALIGAASLTACNNTTNQAEDKTAKASDNKEVTDQAEAEKQEEPSVDLAYYGDTIQPDGAIAASELNSFMEDKDSVRVKVEGSINSSCSKKGCWMRMDLNEEQDMHISFMDYGFFVPKDLDGEYAIVDGYAKKDTLTVDWLRHMAEDAGKSKEEIEKITEPRVELTYVAEGVILKPKKS